MAEVTEYVMSKVRPSVLANTEYLARPNRRLMILKVIWARENGIP